MQYIITHEFRFQELGNRHPYQTIPIHGAILWLLPILEAFGDPLSEGWGNKAQNSCVVLTYQDIHGDVPLLLFHKKFLNMGSIFCNNIPEHGSVFQNFWVFAIAMQTPISFEDLPIFQEIFLKMGTFSCQNDP